jgi:hypothetical protein
MRGAGADVGGRGRKQALLSDGEHQGQRGSDAVGGRAWGRSGGRASMRGAGADVGGRGRELALTWEGEWEERRAVFCIQRRNFIWPGACSWCMQLRAPPPPTLQRAQLFARCCGALPQATAHATATLAHTDSLVCRPLE